MLGCTCCILRTRAVDPTSRSIITTIRESSQVVGMIGSCSIITQNALKNRVQLTKKKQLTTNKAVWTKYEQKNMQIDRENKRRTHFKMLRSLQNPNKWTNILGFEKWERNREKERESKRKRACNNAIIMSFDALNYNSKNGLSVRICLWARW